MLHHSALRLLMVSDQEKKRGAGKGVKEGRWSAIHCCPFILSHAMHG